MKNFKVRQASWGIDLALSNSLVENAIARWKPFYYSFLFIWIFFIANNNEENVCTNNLSMCIIFTLVCGLIIHTKILGNFSFFSVITFPNLQCTSQSDNNQLGTCLSATDCGERSGTEDGT